MKQEEMVQRDRREPTGTERLLLACGVIHPVLLLVPGFLFPQLPAWGSPEEAQVASYTEHYGVFLASRFLFAIASTFLLLFVSGLFGLFRRVEGGAGTLSGLSFGAGVAYVAAQYAIWAMQAATVLVAGQGGEPGTLRALTGVHYALGNYTQFPMAVFLLAASALILRGRIVPRWIGWVGTVAAVSGLVSAAATSDDAC